MTKTKTGKGKQKPRVLAKCGTAAFYKKTRDSGGKPCEACTKAHWLQTQEAYRLNRIRNGYPEPDPIPWDPDPKKRRRRSHTRAKKPARTKNRVKETKPQVPDPKLLSACRQAAGTLLGVKRHEKADEPYCDKCLKKLKV